MSINVGHAAPHFSLQNQNDNTFNLQEHIGKQKLVLYFYPRNESAICTTDVCEFRDHFAEYTKAGAMVIGINDGTIESHKSFAQNHHLPFTLLSDPDNKVLKLFGVKNTWFGKGRETFIIGLDGLIAYKFRIYWKSKAHPKRALEFLRK